ncbi:MAG TPA: GNAT family N-acetyltransferase [Candidatus Baltobacteraceae bacterium]|nr:GNAT family N-acetyltransferase [Candidatus Baltobacteraceae bacterium]
MNDSYTRLPEGYTPLPPGKIANVVTDLEMFAAPPLRAERNAGTLTLVRWERPPLGEYRTLFRRVGAPYLWFSRLELDDAGLAAVIHNPDSEIYVARSGAEVVGWFELDFDQAGECELRFFGLVPEAIGSGAGRWLMNRVIERAWARPIRRFWLHTCTLDHPDAVDFYRRSGFVPFRREIEITDDPRLNGLLPRESAPHVPII